jgi:hypothetical protein
VPAQTLNQGISQGQGSAISNETVPPNQQIQPNQAANNFFQAQSSPQLVHNQGQTNSASKSAPISQQQLNNNQGLPNVNPQENATNGTGLNKGQEGSVSTSNSKSEVPDKQSNSDQGSQNLNQGQLRVTNRTQEHKNNVNLGVKNNTNEHGQKGTKVQGSQNLNQGQPRDTNRTQEHKNKPNIGVINNINENSQKSTTKKPSQNISTPANKNQVINSSQRPLQKPNQGKAETAVSVNKSQNNDAIVFRDDDY